jgi:uncharacterized protein with PIN domain
MLMYCDICLRKKSEASSCGIEKLKIDGKVYRRIKWGNERNNGESPTIERCPCCNVEIDGYHHQYCNREQCPKCGERLLHCKCKIAWPKIPKPRKKYTVRKKRQPKTRSKETGFGLSSILIE